MSKKSPNQLARVIDHQAAAGSALPSDLTHKLQRLMQATAEVKALLVDGLPEQILQCCWVVAISDEELTLSVGSITAANHIRYLQNTYLEVLTTQSITFKQLKRLRVVVANTVTENTEIPSSSVLPKNKSYSGKANQNQGLSQNTKRTIAQAAKHVTTDKTLQNALFRLANS